MLGLFYSHSDLGSISRDLVSRRDFDRGKRTATSVRLDPPRTNVGIVFCFFLLTKRRLWMLSLLKQETGTLSSETRRAWPFTHKHIFICSCFPERAIGAGAVRLLRKETLVTALSPQTVGPEYLRCCSAIGLLLTRNCAFAG